MAEAGIRRLGFAAVGRGGTCPGKDSSVPWAMERFVLSSTLCDAAGSSLLCTADGDVGRGSLVTQCQCDSLGQGEEDWGGEGRSWLQRCVCEGREAGPESLQVTITNTWILQF